MSTKKILLVIGVILAVYFYFKAPSADSIVREMRVDIQNGKIDYQGVTYSAQWSDEIVYLEDIRYIGRAYDKYAPYITNDAIVTTEEFSDPSIVKVTPITNGNMSWRSDKHPKGTLVVLHFIPADKVAHNKLKHIKNGQRVELIGREETDSKIEGSDGSFTALGHSNHKFFLLEDVRHKKNKGDNGL